MKKTIAWFALSALLFLGGCQKDMHTAPAADTLAQAIQETYEGKDTFTEADSAYMSINFGEETRGAVYWIETAAGEMEFGIFEKSEDTEKAVRRYIAQQSEAKKSLAQLYPGEKTDFEAKCFQKALVGREENVFYYFAMDTDHATAALETLRQNLQNL